MRNVSFDWKVKHGCAQKKSFSTSQTARILKAVDTAYGKACRNAYFSGRRREITIVCIENIMQDLCECRISWPWKLIGRYRSLVVHKDEKYTYSSFSGHKNWNDDSLCGLFSPIFSAERHNHTHAGGCSVFIRVTLPLDATGKQENTTLKRKATFKLIICKVGAEWGTCDNTGQGKASF
jgi:hypothetical protein